MAHDWIKVRCNLWTHPKVITLASRLSVTRAHAVGALCALWVLADQHADHGRIKNFSAEAVDALVEVPGFAKAMTDIGWLVVEADSLQLPNYQRHNGTTAKSRATAQRRAKTFRKRNARVTHRRYGSVTRGEERRVEEIRGGEAPGLVSSDGGILLPLWLTAFRDTVGSDYVPHNGDAEQLQRFAGSTTPAEFGERAARFLRDPDKWVQRNREVRHFLSRWNSYATEPPLPGAGAAQQAMTIGGGTIKPKRAT